MNIKTLLTVFAAVFVAELGDKTELTTVLFASDKEVSKLTVFIGACLAYFVSAAIEVLGGVVFSQYIGAKYLRYIAGLGFIGLGIWFFVTP